MEYVLQSENLWEIFWEIYNFCTFRGCTPVQEFRESPAIKKYRLQTVPECSNPHHQQSDCVAPLHNVTRLYLQFHFFSFTFWWRGRGGGVRHHERCFTAVAELNITNPSIPIYVERNLFHKETSKLYVVALKGSWLFPMKVSLLSATANK